MFESYVTVVGTALHNPERRAIRPDISVAHFRIASTPRRFDRETQNWVDGPSLRIRVNCWRRLADHVCGSIFSGDPVIVYGRIVTRDWKTEQGEPRLSYELEAISVGHDLTRGVAAFTRSRAEPLGAVVEDPDLEPLVPADLGRTFQDAAALDATTDALSILANAGLDAVEDADVGEDNRTVRDPVGV
jgi:single-strand DNA-binding protein